MLFPIDSADQITNNADMRTEGVFPCIRRIRGSVKQLRKNLVQLGIRGWLGYAPLVLTVILAAGWVPLLRFLHLTGHISLGEMAERYWFGSGIAAVATAAVLYAIWNPKDAVRPLLARYWSQPRRLLILLPLVAILFSIGGLDIKRGCELTLVAVAILELADRSREGRFAWVRALTTVLPAAMYLFVGLVVVFSYQHIIVTRRFYAEYDSAFAAADHFLLLGGSVAQIAHAAVRHIPVMVISVLDTIYFALFGLLGATLIIIALTQGGWRALQFVSAILTAYFLTLTIYYAWPSIGPFYLCARHFTEFPSTLAAYNIQRNSLAYAAEIWRHHQFREVIADFFVSFPSMHLAQPVIMAWFLHPARRLRWLVLSYVFVLALIIVLLEWHYLVDLPGGVAVAFAAIAFVESTGREPACAPEVGPGLKGVFSYVNGIAEGGQCTSEAATSPAIEH